MKQSTALKHLERIEQRLRSVNGVVCTPLCEHVGVKVKRMWVFGSTAKGSTQPNDLDLLVETEYVGTAQPWTRGAKWRKPVWMGIRSRPCALYEFRKWLRGGMKMVSVHFTMYEAVEIDVKYLVYPRNDWRAHLDLQAQAALTCLSLASHDHAAH